MGGASAWGSVVWLHYTTSCLRVHRKLARDVAEALKQMLPGAQLKVEGQQADGGVLQHRTRCRFVSQVERPGGVAQQQRHDGGQMEWVGTVLQGVRAFELLVALPSRCCRCQYPTL